MDRMIYTALTGVNALMRRQEVHANNLANAALREAVDSLQPDAMSPREALEFLYKIKNL